MTVVALAWLAAAALYWLAATRATGTLGSPAENSGRWAGDRVLLVRPLHGAPGFLRPCLASLLEAARRARARVILAAEDPADPAIMVARQLSEERTDVELRCGPGPSGRNRKIANLMQALSGTAADVLVLSDADVRVPGDYVARVVAPLADPSVGLSTCPYRSVAARSLLSRVDALLTNVRFLPSTCLAVRLEGLHFALGATIALRRDALKAAGGLEPLLDEAADDHALARNVERAGFRLAWVPMVLEHHLGEEPIGRVVRRHLRWLRVIRHARPWGYLGLLVTHGLPPLLWLVWQNGWPLAWALAGWWAYQGFLVWRRRAVLGLRPSDLLLLPVGDVAALLLYAGGWLGRAEPPD